MKSIFSDFICINFFPSADFDDFISQLDFVFWCEQPSVSFIYVHSFWRVYSKSNFDEKCSAKNNFPILSQQRLFNFHTKHFFNIPLSDRNLKWNIFIKKQFFQFQKKNLHSRKKNCNVKANMMFLMQTRLDYHMSTKLCR